MAKVLESLAERSTEEKTKICVAHCEKMCITGSRGKVQKAAGGKNDGRYTSNKYEEHIEKHRWTSNHNFGQIKYSSTSYLEQEKCDMFLLQDGDQQENTNIKEQLDI